MTVVEQSPAATDRQRVAVALLDTMRRVDRVEVGPAGGDCWLHGIGHRLPVRRPIPVAVGLELHRMGVPISLPEVGR